MLAVLLLLALVVRDYLGSRTAAEQASPQALPVLPEELSAQSQSWRWTQTTGDSTRIEVSADDFVQGADGLTTDLRGVVLKIFREDTGKFDRVKSAAMRMLADGSLYSDGETLISLGISADGREAHAVEVVTSGVTFHPTANSARTDRNVDYRFTDGAGSSLGAAYDATTGVLRMLSKVRLERFAPNPDQPSTTIRAGSLVYAEEGARIDLDGRARIEQGSAWLECDSGVISLADGRVRRVDGVNARGGETASARRTAFSAPQLESEFGEGGELVRSRGFGGAKFGSTEAGQRIEVHADSVVLNYETQPESSASMLRRVEARGAAQASLHPPEEGATNTIESESLLLLLRQGTAQVERLETLGRGELRQLALGGEVAERTLNAGRIRMAYGVTGTLEHLAARAGTELLQKPTDQRSPSLRTWSDDLDASFDPVTSEISELHQAGNFGFEEDTRRGSADSARFQPDGGVLELQGQAQVSSEGGNLSSRRIVLNRVSGRIEAEGDVTGFMVQDRDTPEQSDPVGIFAGQEPVFLAAGTLVSDPERQTLEYRGSARLWQGRNRIDADSIVIDEVSNQISARSNVEAVWAEGDAQGQKLGSLSMVRSSQMRYQAQTGVARFEGAVDFHRQGMRVLAEELETALGEGGEDSEMRAIATGSVRIADPPDGSGHRAFGDRAEFDTVASEVVLTGQPAKILMPDGTESEGGSLTYRIAGDRLLVSGQRTERTYTYRPVSR